MAATQPSYYMPARFERICAFELAPEDQFGTNHYRRQARPCVPIFNWRTYFIFLALQTNQPAPNVARSVRVTTNLNDRFYIRGVLQSGFLSVTSRQLILDPSYAVLHPVSWEVTLTHDLFIQRFRFPRAYVLHEWFPIAVVPRETRIALCHELCQAWCPSHVPNNPNPPVGGPFPPQQAGGKPPTGPRGGHPSQQSRYTSSNLSPTGHSYSNPSASGHTNLSDPSAAAAPSGNCHAVPPDGSARRALFQMTDAEVERRRIATMRVDKRMPHFPECTKAIKVCTGFAIIADLCRKFQNNILKAWTPILVSW